MRYGKYNAKRVDFNGYSFASKLEATLYQVLLLMEKEGEIRDIKTQPNIFLTESKIRMIPDFSAFDIALNEVVYYESKGYETDVYRIKRRLWEHYGPGRLRVFKGNAKFIKMTEEIIPKLQLVVGSF